MTEENNKCIGEWKHLPIETKRVVLIFFSKFESRDINFLVYINKHQDQSVFGSRQKKSTDEEIRLRKQVNDYKLKLEKDAEFLHLELARNGFHTVSSIPLTLHPQLRKKVDDELKLQDILPVSEPKTSSSTQQTPNNESLSQQTKTCCPHHHCKKRPKHEQNQPFFGCNKNEIQKTFQKLQFQNQHQRKNHVAVSLSVHFIIDKFHF